MFKMGKFSLIILTRCNLRCRLCCEYVPVSKPFPDMTVEEEEKLLTAYFDVVDYVDTLHLTGGGEPFLHRDMARLIEKAMTYQERFDRLMLFTNGTVPLSDEVLSVLEKYKDRILLQVSQYHVKPEHEAENEALLTERSINCRIRKYYGSEQDFGGWVDFGDWNCRNRDEETLQEIFRNCSVTNVMHGNWRTRDGKVHWCSRSQRGTELNLLPDNPTDYVDLFDTTESVEEKRDKFVRIANSRYISACDYCSGDQGTSDMQKRYPAAEQIYNEREVL